MRISQTGFCCVLALLAAGALFTGMRTAQAEPNEAGQVISGFRLESITPVAELNSTARCFVHEKTSARLLYLSNTDDNKVFSITFRTPPESDNGLTHILEHSVLCGSEKFPTKEPFVDLLKGSLNTFLNAMTFPDKTMYPVASRNDKDFLNLMNVYLDAVFHPNLLNNPFIMKQEGWHYEVDEHTGELTYNGVVYSEMRGALASPEEALEARIKKSLFPNGIYGLESGGLPGAIPTLTQEDFVSFHKKYYTPSNSFIFLYGNGDIAGHLSFIDKEYLGRLEKTSVDSQIAPHAPLAEPGDTTEYYSVNKTDGTEQKTYLTLNYVIGRSTDSELMLGVDILKYMLLESSAAPLRRALTDANIGQDVSCTWDEDLLQPTLSIMVKNSDADRKQEFLHIVEDTLKRLVEGKLDSRLVEAAINSREFELREFEEEHLPKGLLANEMVLRSWLYDADPLMHLRFEPLLKSIREKVRDGYFEGLIKRHLLENRHRSFLAFVPKPGLEAGESAALREKLAKLKDSLSKEALDRIKEETLELKRRQSAPDSPEAVATIPALELTDIRKEPEALPQKEVKDLGATCLSHELFTNKIGYLDLYFDMKAVPNELIPYAALLSLVLGEMDTEKHDYLELAKEKDISTGGIEARTEVYTDKDSLAAIRPKLVVSGKALLGNFDRLLELEREILFKTNLTGKKRLKELIDEAKTGMEDSIAGSGSRFAAMRASSYCSVGGAYKELLGGVSFYQLLEKLSRDFDDNSDQVVENLGKARDLIIARDNLIVSFTADEGAFEQVKAGLQQLIGEVPIRPAAETRFDLKPQRANEALVIPSEVDYVARAADFRSLGYDYSGSMLVLAKMLYSDYLWNRVRVQNGAYGAHITTSRPGTITLASFRDPQIKKTLDAYGDIPKYIGESNWSEADMKKFIIGAIGDLDHPLTPSQKGERATMHHVCGYVADDLERERGEVLSTTPSDIKKYAGLYAAVAEANNLCVVGGDDKIRAEKDLFGSIIDVFEKK